MSNWKKLNRRSVLKGVFGGSIATIGLPWLEAMTGQIRPGYSQDAIPTRAGIWFWGNGIRKEYWIPDEVGTNWQPKGELQPLVSRGLKPNFSVVTGLDIKTASHPHHSGMAGILSGAPFYKVGDTRDTIVSTFDKPSLDQVAVAAMGDVGTPFRSLELGVCQFRGTDEGTTFEFLSHNGRNDVNPSEYNARRAYSRLFGVGANDAERLLARRSVLDVVLGQLGQLKMKLGTADQTRLERHTESIRALERRLGQGPPVCDRPDQPINYPTMNGVEQITEKNAAMSDLAAYALACDLTRVFSVMFSTAGSSVVIRQAGAENSLHQICHDEAVPQPTVHAAVMYMMGQLAVFLDTLKSIPEGNGTLLDHCSILCTSELTEGNVHSNDDFPVLIAGGGGGRLIGGQHVRIPSGNASKAGLTMLRGAGLTSPSFGHGDGRVTEPVHELLR